MKLEFTNEAADEMEQLADKMTMATINIDNAVSQLWQVFNNVSEDVGVHADRFEEWLDETKNAINKFKDALEPIPKKIKETANDIRQYI